MRDIAVERERPTPTDDDEMRKNAFMPLRYRRRSENLKSTCEKSVIGNKK